MKKAFTLMMLVAVGMLIASLAMASNTGFKLNHPIKYEAGRLNISPTAVPYFSPLIDGTGDSRNILEDIDGGACTQGITIRQFRNSAGSRGAYVTQILLGGSCTILGLDFEIEPGSGFEILPQSSATVFNIVGAHDDDDDGIQFQAATGRLNLFTFGIPYHTTWDNSADVLSAPEVCQDGIGQTIRIFRNDEGSRGAFLTHIALAGTPCPGTLLGLGFDLIPGEYYEILVAADTYDKTIIAPHY